MKTTRGGTLVETVAGLCILIPIVLFIIDVTACVICQTANDALAKHAARAACDAANQTDGQAAANQVIATYKAGNPTLTADATLLACTYNSAGNIVTCTTQVVCHLPVPVPFTNQTQQVFQAIDSEPVVGVLN
ncbi:MAG: hypothetical protein P4L53_07755 [Candidatus Obscuribacterales bacterium]|nr:hypothetical protein [Candidatus Obscuribacterales bacterium]